jgi:phosphatidylglycerophosphatase A
MDVLKPYPANASQKLRGGLGIVMDDVIAGVYTNILLQILFRLIL